MGEDDIEHEINPAVTYVKECSGCGVLTLPGSDGRCPNCGAPIG